MKVALVITPYWTVTAPALGLAYISAQLKTAGHSVKVFDLNIQSYRLSPEDHLSGQCIREGSFIPDVNDPNIRQIINNFLENLESQNFDAVGFTYFERTRYYTLNCVQALKKKLPHVRVFLGGHTGHSEESAIQLMKDIPVDAVLRGEADNSVIDLMHHFSDSSVLSDDIPNIPGLIIKNSSGQIISCSNPEAVRNLNALSFPDFSDFPLDDYHTHFGASLPQTYKKRLPFIMSRGCTGNCTFCSDVFRGLFFRSRTSENIFAELEENISRYNVFDFYENGQLMNGDLGVLSDLCTRIIASDHSITWGGFCRINKSMDRNLLARMFAAGCRMICYGMESGSQHVVNLMNKKYQLEDAFKLIRNTSKAGIEVQVSIIVGFPGERWLDFFQTMITLFKLRKYLAQVNINVMQILKDSALFRQVHNMGIVTGAEERSSRTLFRWKSRVWWMNTYHVRRLRAAILAFFLTRIARIRVEVCS